MMFGGKSMGGGGGGGGSMFRAVSRAAVTRSVAGGPPIQEPLSSSNSNSSATNTTTTATTSTSRHTQKPSSSNNLSLSSPTSPFASYNLPLSANSGVPSWPSSPHFDDIDWVTVDNGSSEEDDERRHGFLEDFVLGPVPSRDEVQNAVSALQQVFSPSHAQFVRDKYASELERDVADQITSASAGLVDRVSSVGSELDWMEPSAYLCNSKMLQPHASERVYDAFHLLQTESSVQRMVISLSSDRAVWDAVMSNEVVRELRESFYAAEDNSSQSPDEDADDKNKATNIVKWIFQNTMAKVMEVIEKITKVLGDLIQPPGSEKVNAGASNRFEEKLRTSFMLSVVVLLVVVVTRSHKA
ncbi:unnamed protein product [Prunus armeniaca]|uniref:Uncharacterized protein n=2 Tax=Prunus armeniaca TaxID=36596 RepID=A0A6J5U4Y9_PRUAR|nr:hypothetical protein GBA52_006402 [Prunus armeniaca]CAB4271213.1 unnamed protein product [Prunus armeniaca]